MHTATYLDSPHIVNAGTSRDMAIARAASSGVGIIRIAATRRTQKREAASPLHIMLPVLGRIQSYRALLVRKSRETSFSAPSFQHRMLFRFLP